MELERLKAIEIENKKAEQRKQDEIERGKQLEKQITELRLKEEEAIMLKREEEHLEREKLQLELAVGICTFNVCVGPQLSTNYTLQSLVGTELRDDNEIGIIVNYT